MYSRYHSLKQHIMTSLNKSVIYFASLLVLGSCAKNDEPGTPEHIRSVTLAVDSARLVNADATPGDWMSYGRNYSEDRYSSLRQITKENINTLGLAH
jgi:quinohemoprotein ethanol dehydrogenase